ncbi:MAG: hypothetical protein P4L53_23350 [Candidatus Obscuribacterales bacterium]|nr:hypothetical protein [Candidatus Obscuribacterales bacterium]
MTSKRIRLRRLTRDVDQSFSVLTGMGKLLTEQLRILTATVCRLAQFNSGCSASW